MPRRGPGRPRTRPDYLGAHKGYSSRANRELLRRRGIPHTISEPADQAANRRRGSKGGRPVGYDHAATGAATTIERCYNKLEQWQGIATRYDKTAVNYLGALHLCSAILWAAPQSGDTN